LKIAYIVNEDITKNCGVVQKIRSQISVWKSHGHEVKVFSLSAAGTVSLLENGVIVGRKVPAWGVKKLISYFHRTSRLNSQLQGYNPDVIFMRHIIYFPFTVSILKKCAPYIVELNTNDVNDFRRRFKKYSVYNLFTRGLLFGNAAGYVSVSYELRDDADFSKYKKPTVVIGNGIDIKNIDKKGKSDADPKQPLQAVFIGSAKLQFWHGLDKLVYLASKLHDVIFHIIGPTMEDMINVDPGIKNINNIRCHGYLDEERAQGIVKKCDVGISTLSLYLNGMEEASPLKSRQYLSQGIPIIVGYKDTDLSCHERPFILNIGNYEKNVEDNLDLIKEFILRSREFDTEEIQAFAQDHLDSEAKECKRLDFFQEILDAKKVVPREYKS